MSAIFDSSYVSGDAIFDVSYADEVSGDIVLITAIDAGNVSQGSTVITGASTAEPVVNLAHRPDAGEWRHLHFALENAEGRRPIFKAPRTTRYTNSNPATEYRPVWTQDFVTWYRAPSRTLTGDVTGTIDWQFDEPFPAGRVYVATQPLGRQADAVALTVRLLDDYSTVCSPADSADAGGVYFTSPAELDGTGRECGGHPMFALQLRFGGSTTDGGPKRKLVMIAGLHAAGEQTSWVPFLRFLDFVLDSVDAAAVALRSNWDINLYYNITPNGVYSGDNRTNPSRGSDPNRVWDSPNAEVGATQTAILAGIDGGRFDAFMSWHSYSSHTNPFIAYSSAIHDSVGTRSALVQAFLTEGAAIFGTTPAFSGEGGSERDMGWAELVAGAAVALDTEVQQNGSTAPATYQHIGESWAKTLQAVDASGLFWSAPVDSLVAFGGDSDATLTGWVGVRGSLIASGEASSAGLSGLIGTTDGALTATGANSTATLSGQIVVRGALAASGYDTTATLSGWVGVRGSLAAAGGDSAAVLAGGDSHIAGILIAAGTDSLATLTGVFDPTAFSIQTIRAARRIGNQGRTPNTTFSPKSPAEAIFYGIDFGPLLGTGESVSSASAHIRATQGADEGAAGMLDGAASIAGAVVRQKVRGGVAGVTYQLAATVVTTSGQVFVEAVPLRVLEKT